MRHAGMHFPNGPGEYDIIARLPGSAFLILATEARYHWQRMREARPDALWVWRAIPRASRRPAELGYNPSRVADEVLNLWDEQPHQPGEHFLALNELSLNYERGDGLDDFQDLPERYWRLTEMLSGVHAHIAARLPGVIQHFPAWAPGHGEWEYLDRWKWAAETYDVVHFHAYGDADTIEAEYRRYREAFPTKPLFLGEWNTGQANPSEERRILERLAGLCEGDPLFLGATYFCWHWYDGWSTDFNVDDNPERLALFLNPPTGAAAPERPAPVEPAPAPLEPVEEPPMPTPRSRDEVIEISNRVADEVGIPRILLLAAGVAESNLVWNARRPKTADQDAAYWTDCSGGAWQQTVRYSAEYLAWCSEQGHPPAEFPGSDVIDAVYVHYFNVEHAARIAAAQLRRHLAKAMGVAA